MDFLTDELGKGLFIMLLLSMPAVLTAAGIGLVVGILQAVTQVQEQTIAAAPKILGVFLVIMIMGPFSMSTLIDLFRTSANVAFDIIPHSDEMVLSAGDFYVQKKNLDENYYKEGTPSVKQIMKRAGRVPYLEKD